MAPDNDMQEEFGASIRFVSALNVPEDENEINFIADLERALPPVQAAQAEAPGNDGKLFYFEINIDD